MMEKLKQIKKEKNPEIDNVLSGVNLKKNHLRNLHGAIDSWMSVFLVLNWGRRRRALTFIGSFKGHWIAGRSKRIIWFRPPPKDDFTYRHCQMKDLKKGVPFNSYYHLASRWFYRMRNWNSVWSSGDIYSVFFLNAN